MALKWEKICAGLYKAKVGPEFWQEFTAEKLDEEFGHLCGMWRIKYPTYLGHDCDDVDTLRECKEIADEYMEYLGETR
jgi:hypothetical protein